MKRIDLPYRAPVYVTVNLETGDVERVYLDDESVQPDDTADVLSFDHTHPHRVVDSDAIAAAKKIAEDVDWTSTENRCQVWRGAWGGPADLVQIVTAALENTALRMGWISPEDVTTPTPDESDYLAALRFMRDTAVWEAED